MRTIMKRQFITSLSVVVALASAFTASAQSNYEPYLITTFAGLPPGSADGTGSAARFSNPSAVVADSSGNLYVADTGNSTIRKVTPSGVVTTFAGTAGNIGSADGVGSAAQFNSPGGLAIDSAGNIFVADSGNSTIREITPDGTVSTFAGTPGVVGSADGTGSAAQFNGPGALAIDSSDNIFVADFGNNTIRKITPAAVVTTFAGQAGSPGSVDGTGSAARFDGSSGVAVDSADNVYVADNFSATIREITPGAVVTTIAGLAYHSGHADGTGSAARFFQPNGVTVDSGGNIFVADSNNDTIRKITSGGVVTTFAGSFFNPPGHNDGTGSAASFDLPGGLGVDSSDNIYVADNCTVRKITPSAVVTTLAGEPAAGNTDGTGSAARFDFPQGMAVGAGGNIFAGDTTAFDVRKIAPGAVVTTFAGSAYQFGSADGTGSAARFSSIRALGADNNGNIYVADTFNHTIRKITSSGVVTTVAGLAGNPGSADGTKSNARFNGPRGVTADSAGNLYVGDSDNNTIRKIAPGGVVTTLAGLAGHPGSADGTGSSARFLGPRGLGVDSAGNVYVDDTFNSTIRKITPGGDVTTFAGQAGSPGSADGTGTDARFGNPFGLAIDKSDNVYVTDIVTNTLRKITPSGVVTTLAGLTGSAGTADGAGSSALFSSPRGIAVNSAGILYVADASNHIIRAGLSPVHVTVQTNVPALSFMVDGTSYNAAQTFTWAHGSSHTIATTSPQSGDTGVRYVWGSWNSGGAISHTVAPTKSTTYTAKFTTQYFLTMAAGTGGRVSPMNGWRNSGTTFSITATPATGYSFTSWSGTGTGSFSGTDNPASVTMGGPITETASFSH